MKRLLIAVVLSTFIVSCAKNTPKVLLFIRDGSADLEYMLQKEVGVMKETLETAVQTVGRGFPGQLTTSA